MQKRFADRKQKNVVHKMATLNLGKLYPKAAAIKHFRRRKFLNDSLLAVRLHRIIMTCCLAHFSVLPPALRRLKRSAFEYFAKASVQKVIS